MNERLVAFAEFYLEAAGIADADGVGGDTYIPKPILFTHISHSLTLTGTPTGADIDIQDDASDIVTAMDISTAALYALATPVVIAAGSLMELDLNLAGGSTPKAAGKVVLWGSVNE